MACSVCLIVTSFLLPTCDATARQTAGTRQIQSLFLKDSSMIRQHKRQEKHGQTDRAIHSWTHTQPRRQKVAWTDRQRHACSTCPEAEDGPQLGKLQLAEPHLAEQCHSAAQSPPCGPPRGGPHTPLPAPGLCSLSIQLSPLIADSCICL